MNVTFDARKAVYAYTQAFQKLRRLEGFHHRDTLRAEAGSILKKWAGVTKVATQKQADYRARYRAGKRAFGNVQSIDKNPYRISVNTGLRGGEVGAVWYKTRGGFDSDQRAARKKRGLAANGVFRLAGFVTDGGGFRPAGVRWKRDDWNKIASGAELYAMNLREQLSIGRESIGFARQSVVQIADQLGIDLLTVKGQGISAAGIKKARTAMASSGKFYTNGSGTQGGNETRFYVRLFTHLPFSDKIGMDRSLVGVLQGRAKFIETAYKKGAFDSMKSAARSFPNLINTSRLN